MTDDPLLPQRGSENLKYGVIGAVFLVAAGALVLFMTCQPAKNKSVDENPTPRMANRRDTSFATQTLELPTDEEPAPPEDNPAKGRRRSKRGPACNGEMNPTQVMRAIRGYQPRVRACYEAALRKNNDLQGTVKVTMRISSSGDVADVQVGGSLRDAKVTTCVRREARRWTFPAPKGGCAVVSAPFNFKPKL